jgi:uncharacterized protein (DUF4415 family)
MASGWFSQSEDGANMPSEGIALRCASGEPSTAAVTVADRVPCLSRERRGDSDHFGTQSVADRTQTVRELPMKREYDFTDSVRNPYAKHFRKQVTMRLGTDVIEYFKALARETGVPYQNLINLYLRDCAHSGKKLALKWAS